jgi:hypothetical protein
MSEWIEIKEGVVPKVGDELIGVGRNGKPFELIIVSARMVKDWIWSDYIEDWFTHFRPLDPPAKRRLRADNGDPDTIVPAPGPHKKHPGYPTPR